MPLRIGSKRHHGEIQIDQGRPTLVLETQALTALSGVAGGKLTCATSASPSIELRNMSPSFMMTDLPNGCVINAVVGGNDLQLSMVLSYFANFIRRQFGLRCLLATTYQFWMKMPGMAIAARNAFRMCLRAVPLAACEFFRVKAGRRSISSCNAALADTIISVILGRSLRKMIWTDARRPVARMQHLQFSGVIVSCEKIGHAGRDKAQSIISSTASRYEAAVAFLVFTGDPAPTISPWSLSWRFVDFCPKAGDVLQSEMGNFTMWLSQASFSLTESSLVRAVEGVSQAPSAVCSL
jgi:hypothetical protein